MLDFISFILCQSKFRSEGQIQELILRLNPTGKIGLKSRIWNHPIISPTIRSVSQKPDSCQSRKYPKLKTFDRSCCSLSDSIEGGILPDHRIWQKRAADLIQTQDLGSARIFFQQGKSSRDRLCRKQKRKKKKKTNSSQNRPGKNSINFLKYLEYNQK